MHPLDGPRLKIERAKAEIDRLSSMERTFQQNTQYYIIRAEFNPNSGKYVQRIRMNGEPPSLEWGICIGEIAHNLRCALNYLVYQLALLNSNNSPKIFERHKKHLQFPIFLYFDDIGQPYTYKKNSERMIHLLSPEHQKRIEMLQPFQRGRSTGFNPPYITEYSGRNNPLYWLEEINNADKHRLIQVVGAMIGVALVMEGQVNSPREPFIDPSMIIRDGVKIGETPAGVHVDASVTPNIAFSDSCEAVKTIRVCYAMEVICDFVTETVESFANDF